MNHRTRTIRSALALLLLAGVLALSGCGSAPLPPLFIARAERSASAQPAAPAANAAAVAAAAPTESAPAAAAPTESAPAEAAPTETPATAAAAASDAGQVITPTVAGGQASAVVAAPTATPAAPTATPAAPTATRVAPTATRVVPAATRAPARPAATPTPEWPKSLTITADDIEQGAASVPGLQVTGLDVQFASDSMTLSFDSLRYSFVSMRNVTVQGHFTVNNCDVEFVADSINPRNLATSAIPGFVNQSLDQQLAPWCVESLAVQPGQLVVSVRPR
ncbi:MAG TPA: hypothetical protein PKM78_02435 [Anaerolineae bacterium]|nr:hypothetical protein [Anaerolineae bacterium]HNU03404.1 hypothetical protein [Anaerolineae bacterium]